MSSDDESPPPARMEEDDQTQPGARPVPAPTESTHPGAAESATSDLRDFSNIPTSQISSTQLKEQLAEMRKGGEPESTVEEDDPSEAAGSLGARLRALPKWVVPTAAVGLILLIALPVALAGPDVMYLSESHGLRSGPADSPVYAEVATLVRGARLEVLEAGEFSSLVRDAAGRVGYINRTLLSADRPEATPDYAFADCDSDPRPGGTEACRLRALEQFESCRVGCDEDGACLENCQKRLASCGRSCEGQKEKPPEPVGDLAEGTAETQEPEPDEEPQSDAEVEDPASSKKKRKSKRRRRRRKATPDPAP